ncbi:sensor domain-containing diguanylate cyclase [Gluconacetobacter asukensis]|uniref:Diguanylate cyclase n=1 Tax=Gluconacetobacter asukensis TaxID=1017181 RepID=A0A7W4P3T8_9PROT|nr:sensor domain-containing diguanylate cyclase [Gluconacetobacter asukensis]MBB2173070.1 diguanylate cyclase [Gluconacetobacter asukensis]
MVGPARPWMTIGRSLTKWRPFREAEQSHGAGLVLILLALFTGLVAITRFLIEDNDGFSVFWPANAVMLVALLILPEARALAVIGACGAINLCINYDAGWTNGEAIQACLLNVVQVAIAAPLTRRFCGARTDLARLPRFVAFSIIAVASSAIEGGLGVLGDRFIMGDPDPLLRDWMQWTACDALGLIIATPGVMYLVRNARGDDDPRRSLSMFLALLCLAVTIASFIWGRSPLLLFSYPLLTLVAFRARPVWTSVTVFAVAVCAAAFTRREWGPIALFSGDDVHMHQFAVQAYLVSLVLTVLPANVSVDENRRYLRRMLFVQERLRHASSHDDLTSALNRRTFEPAVEARMRLSATGALLIVDLDHFKQINDTFGHSMGDEVLRVFTQRLIRMLRDVDGLVARYGGDEFVAFTSGVRSAPELEALCSRICHELALPYDMPVVGGAVTASIGAALSGPGAQNFKDLIRRADLALYKTKAAGRNGYTLLA